MHGNGGDDLLIGGSGLDMVSFADASVGVHASLKTQSATGDGNDRFVSIERVVGSPFADWIEGTEGADTLLGGVGADTLMGLGGDDTFDFDPSGGGFGVRTSADLQFAGVVDGGGGRDRLLFGNFRHSEPLQTLQVDLRDGSITLNGQRLALVVKPVEALYDVKGYDSTFIGSDAPEFMRCNRGSGGGGDDQFQVETSWDYGQAIFDGGAGIDLVFVPSLLGQAMIGRGAVAASFELTMPAPHSGGSMTISLQSIERLVFSDAVLAFGDRAMEVVEVAFALWSPAIQASRSLFGKGVNWYDQGHTFGELVSYALSFHQQLSDTALAQALVANVPGVRSTADTLALIAGHGGGDTGRAYVTELFARDAAHVRLVDLAGLPASGIECGLYWGGQLLWQLPQTPAG